MIFNHELVRTMWEMKIFLSPNPTKPEKEDSHYGWLPINSEIELERKIVLEERVGLYGGGYIPSIGAPGFPGFASMGMFSYSFSPLPDPMKVGRYCSISTGLKILDSHHNYDRLTTSALFFRPNNLLFEDIIGDDLNRINQHWDIYDGLGFPIIENDVWIGRDVTLKMGVTIHNGSIVAANSVVTKDVPAYSIVAGNPATVKKFRFPDEEILKLSQISWWDFFPEEISKLANFDIYNAIEILENLPKSQSYSPEKLILS